MDTCLKRTPYTTSKFAIDHTVRQYAIKLKDTNLLRNIAGGDLMPIKAKYDKSCMTKLFRDARNAQGWREETDIHHECLFHF